MMNVRVIYVNMLGFVLIFLVDLCVFVLWDLLEVFVKQVIVYEIYELYQIVICISYLLKCIDVFFVLDIDECFNGFCYNNGICINIEGSYYCYCGIVWMGDSCQIGWWYFLCVRIVEIFINI